MSLPRRHPRPLLFLLFFWLGACSLLPLTLDPVATIEHKLQRGDFATARTLVAEAELEGQQKQTLLQNIDKAERQFRSEFNQTRRAIERLIREDHWSQARQQARELQQRYPDNRQVIDYRTSVEQRFRVRRLVLDAELLVDSIKQVQASRQNYLRRGRIDNREPEDYYYQHRLQQLSRQLADIALKLARLDELIASKQYSQFALKTFDSSHTRQRHREILSIIESRKASQLARLEQAYQTALQDDDLLRAHRLLNAMLFLDPDNPSYRLQQRELQQRIRQRVAILLKQGRALYSQDEIEAAIEVWEEALRLDPSHAELRRRLDHAYKARATLERIRRQQGQ